MSESSLMARHVMKSLTKQIDEPISSDCLHQKKTKMSCAQIKSSIYKIIAERNNAMADRNLETAGLKRTDNPEVVRCDECDFEVTEWKTHTDLLALHTSQRPGCPFISKREPAKPPATTCQQSVTLVSPRETVKCVSKLETDDKPSKRQKVELMTSNILCSLYEPNTVQQIRKRTFSHWVHRQTPSKAQMVEAGFFNCNVGDRVMCIYCNLICQQWVPQTDDPCEVHRTLSPNCIYVKAKLIRRDAESIVIVNDSPAGGASSGSSPADQFHCQEFVATAACNPGFTELPKRSASFAQWSAENSPSPDDLVRAGFFYTGVKSIVTCFYCNGSLQNWGPNDNPTIEHARWFPHCAYAKQLCGEELYRKIQESKRMQQDRARVAAEKEKPSSETNANINPASQQLVIPDETILSRLVAARLDLPVSQSLLHDFKLSIIKRCWEDQLRLKRDDFASDADLRMACTILQKQITFIDGKKENIIVPKVAMKKIREQEVEKQQAEAKARQLAATKPIDAQAIQSVGSAKPDDTNIEMTAAEERAASEVTTPAKPISNQEETNVTKPAAANINQRKETSATTLTNPCVVCMEEEKRLACMPCGHLAACVPCGHSLRCCPVCRREIQAFVKIYV